MSNPSFDLDSDRSEAEITPERESIVETVKDRKKVAVVAKVSLLLNVVLAQLGRRFKSWLFSSSSNGYVPEIKVE